MSPCHGHVASCREQQWVSHCHHHHHPRVHAVRWIMYRHSAPQLPCFYMWLFILFLNVLNWSFCSLYVHYPSKLLSYLLPTLTINTLSIVQSAAKSEHNAAWEVLAAVLQSAVRSSGGGGVETSFPQQNKYISTFPISPAVENYNFVYRVSHTFNFAGWNGILNFMNFKQLNL